MSCGRRPLPCGFRTPAQTRKSHPSHAAFSPILRVRAVNADRWLIRRSEPTKRNLAPRSKVSSAIPFRDQCILHACLFSRCKTLTHSALEEDRRSVKVQAPSVVRTDFHDIDGFGATHSSNRPSVAIAPPKTPHVSLLRHDGAGCPCVDPKTQRWKPPTALSPSTDSNRPPIPWR